jgi:hypothetical protein
MPFKKFKDGIINLISSGLPKKQNLEAFRRTVMLNFVLIFCVATLVILAPVAAYQGSTHVAIVDLFAAIVLASFVVLLRKTKNYSTFSVLGVFVGFSLYSYLLITGGPAMSGYVWVFTFPIISIFLLGSKSGSKFSWALFFVGVFVFSFDKYFSFIANYDLNVRLRTVGAYLIIFLFSYVMEKSRGMVQDVLRDSTIKVEKIVGDLERSNAEKEALIKDLRATMEELKTLKGIIPICSHCKKIRDDKGYWDRVENYVTEHSLAKFSHGICPECLEKNYPEDDLE